MPPSSPPKASDAPADFPEAPTPTQAAAQQPDPLDPTIFHELWWLDLACDGRQKLAEVTSNGKTIGRLPYLLQKPFGITCIDVPMLTHFLGPGIVAGEGSANTIFLKKLAITRELIHKLPPVALTRFKLHHSITDAVAFQEQGFRTSVQFTHEISPLPQQALWANLRNKTRNVIRRSQEQEQVRDLQDADEFMAFYVRNLSERGMRSNLDERICKRLISAAIERGRGRIIVAYNKGVLVAANFYIWDFTSYYFLLTTRGRDASNGTTSLLLWQAIQDASSRGLTFDSDGLNSNGSILFLAGLGGTIKPRYIVSKARLTGLLLEQLQRTVWGKNYFVRG